MSESPKFDLLSSENHVRIRLYVTCAIVIHNQESFRP
jgi:hypothetical protein